MFGIIFIGTIALGLIICTICLFKFDNEPSDIREIYILAVFTTIFCIGTLIMIVNYTDKTPKAIDVYRNKTTIKINGYYQDSTFIPKDTIVVFKQ